MNRISLSAAGGEEHSFVEGRCGVDKYQILCEMVRRTVLLDKDNFTKDNIIFEVLKRS